MIYSQYDTAINTEEDLKKYVAYFEKDIEEQKKKLEEFIERGKVRIDQLKQWETNKEYKILGRTFKDGRNKEIMLIIRYPDGTQRDERYSFSKINDMRTKLSELKNTYSGVDWSAFEEEI